MSTDEIPGDETNDDAAAPDAAAAESAPAEPETAAAEPQATAAEPETAAAAESEAAAAEPETAEPPETPAVAEPEIPATEMPSSDLPELSIGSTSVSETVGVDYVPVFRGKIDRFGVAMGTGRRKSAVARVRIKEGSGKITVNDRPLDEYFCIERDREFVLAPLKLLEKQDSLDISVRVNGGGTTGQTGAIVLGIGRALQGLIPESHHELSAAGFLTRDSRMVERKKYGYRKARRSFQFSKR